LKWSKKISNKSRLRETAEAFIAKHPSAIKKIPSSDIKKLIEDLQIHQVELELQNEELQRSQIKISELHKEYVDLYYDFAPCAYITLNARGFITRINLTGISLLGLERTRIKNRPFRLFVESESLKDYYQALKASGSKKQTIELKLKREQGLPVWVQADIVVDLDKSGTVSQRRMTLVDITNRKKTEADLRLSEMKFRYVTESIKEVFWLRTCGIDEMIYVSPAYENIWGRSRANLYNSPRSFIESIHPENVDEYLELLEHYHLRGRPYTCDYRIVPKNGEILWIRERGYPVSQSFNGRSLMTGVCTDITLSRRAKTDLQELNTALKVLLDRREKEKHELGENVLKNIEELILPYLKKLSKISIDQNGKTYLNIIDSNLKELLSPFGSQLHSPRHSLTPTEIRIADLIRNGKTTKEIAKLLGVSNNSVMVHRHHIRKKLDILNKKINLRTYLKSII